MKRYIRAFLSVLIMLAVLTVSGVSALGAETVSGNRSVDGVAYKLSDDGEYYTVVGRSEDFPKLTIVSDIDGIPVTEIADNAFTNTSSLTEISIPASVTSIGKAAFRFCENLMTVTLPARLKYLPEECFYDCRILKTITLPKTLIGIGDRAFYNCTMLGDLSIPSSVTDIGYDTFHGCESIVLDTSENELAAQYARDNNINTDFKNTSTYFFILILIGIAVALVLFALFVKWFRGHIEKHPSHDPTIYLDRFTARVGRLFGFIGDKISIAVKFILSKLTAFIDAVGRWNRQRNLRKAEKKSKDKKSDKS